MENYPANFIIFFCEEQWLVMIRTRSTHKLYATLYSRQYQIQHFSQGGEPTPRGVSMPIPPPPPNCMEMQKIGLPLVAALARSCTPAKSNVDLDVLWSSSAQFLDPPQNTRVPLLPHQLRTVFPLILNFSPITNVGR